MKKNRTSRTTINFILRFLPNLEKLFQRLEEERKEQSYHKNRLEFVRKHLIRYKQSELEQMKTEENLLRNENEALKTKLDEQIRQSDEVLKTNRIFSDEVRSSFEELWKQIVEEMDFFQIGITITLSDLSPIDFRRSIVREEILRIFSTIENKIREENNEKARREFLDEQIQQKIIFERQNSQKRLEDLRNMEQIENELQPKIDVKIFSRFSRRPTE